ncbi:hypothetical protein [Marinomonas fungiae]|uniref:hypothetical protein n=1 Tax=Marinomonas fungiae TaxID=1137284 RepID=UPI0011464CFD|nr:hypothetical protein [Marinomonas fungiae]
MKYLYLTCVLLFSLPAFSADNDWLKNITGDYEGEIYNDNVMTSAVTSFYVNKEGEVIGTYLIVEDDNDNEPGILTNLRVIGENSVSMTWIDKYGQGTLNVLFSEDFDAFTGFWGTETVYVNLPWYGER